MSMQSPVGTLDIKNATLRVGKLEVSNVQGIDTALNVTRANSVLVYDDQVSTTTFSGFTSTAGVRDTGNGYLNIAGGHVYWGQKLPNSWVMDFEMDIRSGTSAGPLYANVFSTTNTGGDGYSFTFNDNNDKITLKYDGTTLAETTVSGLFTASENWQKVVINYERGLIAISVDGSRKFYYKDIERSTPYVNGEYINFSSASTDGRKIRDLRIVNGEKWVYSGESNVAFTQGSVGVGVSDPAYTLDVGGDINLSGSFYQGGSPFVSSLWTDGANSLYYRSNVEVGTGNLFVDTTTSNVGIRTTTPAYELDVAGNVNANYFLGDGSLLTGLVTKLEDVVDNGNVSSNTIQLTNTDVGLKATGNVEAARFIGDGSHLTGLVTDLQSVVDNGNVSSNTIQLTNTDVGLKATGNVEAARFIGDGSHLTGLVTDLQSVSDNGNTTSNTIQFTNATTGFVTESNVGIANTNPQNDLDVGSNLSVLDTGSNVLSVTGNVSATSITIGDFQIVSAYGLDHVTNENNQTTDTIISTNATTGFNASSNIVAGGTVQANKIVSTSNLEVGTANLFVDTTTSNVGIGTNTPDYELDVVGNVNATYLIGDGSAISSIQSSNVSDFGSNVTRITNLESSRALKSDLNNNSSRITNLSSNLSDNSSRITALETGNMSISGDKTFTGDIIFESNIHMNGGNVLVANTVNMTVSDPIIELGSNNLNTGDLGIIMTRHGATNSNVAIVYDEDVDILRMGYTLNGASDSVISLDSNALVVSVQGELAVGSNLEVGTANLFVDTTTSNVGVGVSSPAYKLDVDGDINLSTGSTLKINGTDAVFSRWTANGSDIYRPSGNVGIGTTGPIARLDIDGGAENNTTPALAIRGGLYDPSDLYVLNTYNVSTGVGYAAKVIGVNIKNKVETDNTVQIRNNVGGVTSAGAIYLGADDTTNQGIFGVLGGTGNAGTTLSEILTVKGSGNVGIGIVDPNNKLTINGGTGVSSGGGVLSVRQKGDTQDDGITLTSSNTNSTRMYKDVTGHFYLYNTGGGRIAFQNITGNFGIGTTSPTYKLNISTDTNYDGISLRDSTRELLKIAKGGNGSYINMFESGTSKVNISTGGDSYINGGNVGIGTTGPARPLTVESSSFDGFRIKRTTAGGGSAMELINGDGDEWTVGVGGTGTFGIYDGATFGEQFTIDASGNVGIGDSSPSYKLSVNGDVKISGTNTYLSWNNNSRLIMEYDDSYRQGIHFQASSRLMRLFSTTNDSGGGIVFLTRAGSGGSDTDYGSERMRITSNGNVGIGVTSPTASLDVATTSSTAALLLRNTTNASGCKLVMTDNYPSGGTPTQLGTLEYVHANGSSFGQGNRLHFSTTESSSVFSLEGTLMIGVDGKDSGAMANATNAGRRNLWIQSTFGGNTSQNYGWWIGAQNQSLGTSDNDLYFGVVRNGSMNIAGLVQDNKTQGEMNFTGQHRTFVKDTPTQQLQDKEGLIVSADQDEYIRMSGGIARGSDAITINESLPVVSLSTKSNDKKCFGVLSTTEDPENRFEVHGNFKSNMHKEFGDTRVYVNSVGEGGVWVTNINGNLESGDYITTSNVVGYGMKQDDDILHNYTVAKITMNCDFNPKTQPRKIIKKELANVDYWIDYATSEIKLEEYEILPENEREIDEDKYYKIYKRDIQKTNPEKEHFVHEQIEELVNVLDEHGQLQWEDHPTDTEKAYKIRYLASDGTQTDEANAVHIAAFVGCTYHCG